MTAARRPVVLAANSAWNIVNFRPGLIRALRAADYDPVVVAPLEPESEQRMKGLGVECLSVAIDRSGINPFADFKLLLEYRRLLRRLRPVAWLGYTIKPNVYGGLAAGSLGIPAIPNVSGLGTAFISRGPIQHVVTRLYRLAFRRSPVVFFQNEEDRELFVERRIVRPGQARVLRGSGVDLKRFVPAPLPDGAPVFLLIGRMLRDKGVEEFVEAAGFLRDRLPGARFQLLGPIDAGNRTAISRHRIDRWVEAGTVEYLGTVDDVRPAVGAATAVVLPSYREGLPRSLLEAAAMARPLIATDVPGCRQVVEHGTNGLLCAPRASQSLADAMAAFARLPPERRTAMGKAARHTVEERFSEDLVVNAYLDVLAGFSRSGKCHV